jgi:hypothetical protein
MTHGRPGRSRISSLCSGLLRWEAPGFVLLCTVATYCCCLALASYVAVVLALVALLQSALSLVSFALEDLSLPDQTLVDSLVGVLWLSELHGDGRCSLGKHVPGQLSYVLDLCLWNERPVVLYNLISGLFEPGRVHRAGAYAMCKDSIRRDPYCGPVVDAVDPVVCKLFQCFTSLLVAVLMLRSPIFSWFGERILMLAMFSFPLCAGDTRV